MIKSLQLNNFRSYDELFVELSPQINVFIGKNGQGKTNLLESIYFISNIRSHRTRNDLDLIKLDNEFARIIVFQNNSDKIMSVIHDKGKYFTINDNPVKKTSEVLGKINTVLFFPTETRLFSDSPSVRRTFFDVEIGKVSNKYINYFQEYTNLLKDRNKLLKNQEVDLILLDILSKKMASVQMYILEQRKLLVKFINMNIDNYLQNLIDDDLYISIEYKSLIKDCDESSLIQRYKQNEKKDIFNKVTSEGIHRDDYIIYSNGIEVEKFLSQGQIRIVLLAVKLVLVDYILEHTNVTPILLLDDVLSELDLNNQRNLLNSIPSNIQTIITTTEDHEIFKHRNIKKYFIKNSSLVLEEELNV